MKKKEMINEVCTDVVIIAQEAEVVWIQVQLNFKAKYKEARNQGLPVYIQNRPNKN